ncbi:MAG: tRNA pseudouridine(38-40) synthase TruA [Chloroflexi bacterium]|nr:tRNA pseudouridine(38-40) synthase TruA [Chloroflexota bacterium]
MAYDGTRYAGFQVQPNAPTVQGELERALTELCNEPVRITGAGRTDAGVHATGQVINFRTASALDGERIGRGVNALVPADIAISAVEPVGEDFHARYSATGRTYEYRIRNGPERHPLERHREHWLPVPLDRSALDRATRLLHGRHDFAAFAAGEGGVREVRSATWSAQEELLRFEITADAFLRGMVRAIVGTLLWVGRGRIGVEDFGALIEARDRSKAGPSAPANGLCLISVEYGGRQRNTMRRNEDDEE